MNAEIAVHTLNALAIEQHFKVGPCIRFKFNCIAAPQQLKNTDWRMDRVIIYLIKPMSRIT